MTENTDINKEEAEEIDKFLAVAGRINLLKKDDKDIVYCLQEKKFYLYEIGFYKEIHEYDLMAIMARIYPRSNKFSFPMREQIIKNMGYIKRRHLSEFNKLELINLENGLLDPYTGFLEKHRMDYISTIRIPYKFNDEAKCDLWLKTLNEILEGDKDKINILQEFFGYCLTRQTKHERALLLLGESRTGKSTILNTLRFMVGDENCCAVGLEDISDPQYTPMLINKLVSIDSDVSAKAFTFEKHFKVITSGESINCNQKFIPSFKFDPFCKLVMGANIFPKITDYSSAFYKRLILIPCDRVFELNEQNINLKEELKKELPGILNWALEGLHRLENRGKFEKKDFMTDAIKELEDSNNPSNLFFEEFITVESGAYIEKGFLFEKYKDWCFQTKNGMLNKSRFATAVYRKYQAHTPKDTQVDGKRIWRNLSFNEYPRPISTGDHDRADREAEDKIMWEE